MSSSSPIRVLVLGASGMLGNAALRVFADDARFEVTGTARSPASIVRLPQAVRARVRTGIDVENLDQLTDVFGIVRPDVVVNSIGLVKQLAHADDPLSALPVNALLPHRLARLCAVAGSRLIHVSTDCVFSGKKGRYLESDEADAKDLYGRSKHLGEVDYPHAVTLRTSIIGHELDSAHGLIGWFLAQQDRVRGFTRAIFSGLPTVELATVMRDVVVPRPELRGVYHVSAEPISKNDLLQLVAERYGKSIEITPDEQLVIDRSLDSSRFRAATGYMPPTWPELIRRMHTFQ